MSRHLGCWLSGEVMVQIHSLAWYCDSLSEEVAFWESLFDRRLIWNGCWKRPHLCCYYLDAPTASCTSDTRLEALPSRNLLLRTYHSMQSHACFSAQSENWDSLCRHAGSDFNIQWCSTKNEKRRQTQRRIRRSPAFPEGPEEQHWLLAWFRLPSCSVESAEWMTLLSEIRSSTILYVWC